jgi:hydroxypyruvate reductase
MAAMARQLGRGEHSLARPCAIILGGETVVHVRGAGKGGRNQEIALAAAEGIAGMENLAVFSIGSDGTDGPTDAAGGIVDGSSAAKLEAKGLRIRDILDNNDAYHGLAAIGGLVMTGPTGTNVNDVSGLLAR